MHLTTIFKIHKANTGRIERRNRPTHSHCCRLQCLYQSLTEYIGKTEKISKGKLEKRQQSNIKMSYRGRKTFEILQANITYLTVCFIYLSYKK